MKAYKLFITSSFLFLATVSVAVSAGIPAVGPSSWPDLIIKIAKIILQIAMSAAVIVIIWSGILFMSAGGSEERITRAKKTFFWALVGLAVCLIGMGFVDLVKDILGVGEGNAGGGGGFNPADWANVNW